MLAVPFGNNRLPLRARASQPILFHKAHEPRRELAYALVPRLALRRYLNASPFAPTGDAPLWWGRNGALTLQGLKSVVRDIGERAGLKKRLGPHTFRRTFATWSLRSGIDLEQLRQLMGHSDYTVLRQYLSLVEADLKQAHQQHSPLRNLRKRK